MTDPVSSPRVHEPSTDPPPPPPPPPPPRPIPRYLGDAGQEMFSWWHPPADGQMPRAGVVICPPWGYNAIPTHRALRHLAQRLAADGVLATRVDYPGTGDSAGTDGDPARVDAWVGGIALAIRELKREAPSRPVYVVGLRLGALLGAAAAVREAVDGVVLWAAARSGRRYVREIRALSLAGGGSESGEEGAGLESAGYLVTGETMDALRTLDIKDLPFPEGLDVLIVDRDDLPPDQPFLDELSAKGVRVECHRPAGFQDMVAEPHYAKVPGEALDTIVDWVRERTMREPTVPFGYSVPEPDRHLELRDGIVEEPIRFGPDGRLFGILCRPAAGPPGAHPVIVLLNAGSVPRVGPNRMYVDLARHWAALGRVCLRFDIGGIGDSAPPAGLRENHPYAANAHDDIEAALDMLRDHTGAHRFVLAGVCSGAYSAFSSGLRAAGVVRVVLVNPLTFYWKEGMTLDTPTYQHFLAVRHYRHSVRAWSSWKKLLSGKVNPAPVVRIGMERARRLLYARWQGVRHALGLDRNDSENLRRDLRHLVDRGVLASFVFAAGDPGYDLLMLEAGGVVRALERTGRLSLDVIGDADHTFTPFAPRRRLAELLTSIVTGIRLPRAEDAGV